MAEHEETVSRKAIKDWCEAVGWCPSIRPEAKAKITFESAESFQRHNKEDEAFGFMREADQNIFIDRDRIAMLGEEWLWDTLAHELGHYGIEGHTSAGLMMPGTGAVPATTIDHVAVDEWCRQTSSC